MQLNKIFMSLGLEGKVADLTSLFLIILLISIAFWFLIGRFKLQNFLINIYISLALTSVVPMDFTPFAEKTSFFVFIAFLILLIMLDKYLFDIHQYGSGMAIWQVIIFILLEVILLFSVILSFLPAKDIWPSISKDLLIYFTDSWWRVLWMVLPLFFLIFIKKR